MHIHLHLLLPVRSRDGAMVAGAPRWTAVVIASTAAFALAGPCGATDASAAPSRTTLYKSTGPDGRTVYSDRQPADAQPARTLTFEIPPSSPLSPATLAYIEQLRNAKPAPVAAAPAGETVLYTTTWCGYCKQARAYLAGKRIAFREIDTETPNGAAAYTAAGGAKGVPFMTSHGRRIGGFSVSAYDAVFQAARN